jgi:mannosyltransferase OCH1-like enzyme
MFIPKKVHQIWIGPKKRPDIWMNSVKEFCEVFDYEYILWDDQKVSEMNMVNREWYNLESTYNGKSDILRYEILYQNGGIYIDADMVIINDQNLHSLISDFNADAGFGFEVDGMLICGAVSLAKKESEFIKKCIEKVPSRDMSLMAWESVGPKLITDVCYEYQTRIPLILYKSTVFYPMRWHGIQDVQMHKTFPTPPESVMFQYGYSTNNLEHKI